MIAERLQENWDNLSNREKIGLLSRIGQPRPVTDNTDEMGDELRGRLIMAIRDGGNGFSIEEFQRARDALRHSNFKPGPLGTKWRKFINEIDRYVYPRLHEDVSGDHFAVSRLLVALGNIYQDAGCKKKHD
jgi:hypothetical protein